jgi:glycosidase
VYNMQRVVAGAPCISGPTAGQSCDYWEAQVNSGPRSTLYYRFIIVDGTRTVYYEDNTDAAGGNIGDGGAGVARDASPDASWAINVYDPAGYTIIPWTRDGVYYQIFPDRFRNGDMANDPTPSAFRYNYPTPEDGITQTAALDQIQRRPWGSLPEGYCRAYKNDDGSNAACAESPRGRDYYGGDLRGVIQKLDYLQNLGVSIIYFNPIFAAGSNHRYDTRDYFKVDPSLGTLQEFKELVSAAHARGMYVVLDGVFNHLSSDSAIFDRYRHYAAVGACESADSPYRSWFYFRPPSQGQPAPCAPATAGGANTYYDGWFGFDSIPVINKNLTEVQSYFYSATLSLEPGLERNVALYWLAQGIDGWRLDVASDPSFPEQYWREFRAKVKGYKPDAVIIGEMWKKFEHLPFLQGDKMDGVQGYRTRDAVLGFIGRGATDVKGFPGEGQPQNASQFANKLLSVIEDFPPAALHSTMNELGTHDTARLRWLLTPGANNREARELDANNVAIGAARQRLAALTLFSQPMPPGIYYGDEIGVTGFDDPDDRRTIPWNDPYRLFLPVVAKTAGDNPTALGTPLAADGLTAGADRDMYAFYKSLAAQRRAHPALRTGDMEVLLTDDARNVIAYSRSTITDTALIVMNVGEADQTVTIPLTGTLRNGLVLSDTLGSLGTLTTADGSLTLTIGARKGALLVPVAGQDITPPDAPTISLDGRGDGSVSLSWQAVPGAASYRVYRSRLSHGGYELVTTTPLTGTTFSDSGLVNGVPYYYVVTALDAAGNESELSNEVSGVPAFPLGFANVQFPATAALTVGTDNAGKVTVYIQVYAAGHTEAPGADPAIIAQLGYGITGTNALDWTWLPASYNVQSGNNDEYQADIRPRAAGSYAYLARFSSDGGATWFYGDADGSTSGQLGGDGGNKPGALTANASADTTPPPAPASLVAVNGGPSTILLGWQTPVAPDLYAYNLFRSTTPGGPYTQISGDIPAGTLVYSDTAVTSGVAYYYVVRALDTSFNASVDSNEATATPAPRTVSITFNATVATDSGITEDDTLYIGGEPGSILCDGGSNYCDPQVKQLTKLSLTSWTITIAGVPENARLKYKYTLGSYTFVEKDAGCGEINNREITATYGSGGTQTVNDAVPRFRNRAGCPS